MRWMGLVMVAIAAAVCLAGFGSCAQAQYCENGVCSMQPAFEPLPAGAVFIASGPAVVLADHPGGYHPRVCGATCCSQNQPAVHCQPCAAPAMFCGSGQCRPGGFGHRYNQRSGFGLGLNVSWNRFGHASGRWR